MIRLASAPFTAVVKAKRTMLGTSQCPRTATASSSELKRRAFSMMKRSVPSVRRLAYAFGSS